MCDRKDRELEVVPTDCTTRGVQHGLRVTYHRLKSHTVSECTRVEVFRCWSVPSVEVRCDVEVSGFSSQVFKVVKEGLKKKDSKKNRLNDSLCLVGKYRVTKS